MTQALINFDHPSYPVGAGFRASAPETSRDAARSVDAVTWRTRALRAIRTSTGLTADEVAARLGAGILTIRPRITELNRAGAIVDSSRRRPNASGKMAVVWEAAQ